jgi:hypothetical protein
MNTAFVVWEEFLRCTFRELVSLSYRYNQCASCGTCTGTYMKSPFMLQTPSAEPQIIAHGDGAHCFPCTCFKHRKLNLLAHCQVHGSKPTTILIGDIARAGTFVTSIAFAVKKGSHACSSQGLASTGRRVLGQRTKKRDRAGRGQGPSASRNNTRQEAYQPTPTNPRPNND